MENISLAGNVVLLGICVFLLIKWGYCKIDLDYCKDIVDIRNEQIDIWRDIEKNNTEYIKYLEERMSEKDEHITRLIELSRVENKTTP